jgi:hypothetical protein
VFAEFPLIYTNLFPTAITSGPDGNLWFTDDLGIERIALSSVGSPWSQSKPLSVDPAAGSGPMATFLYTFSAPQGLQNLNVMNVLINNALDGRKACYLAYIHNSGTLVLVDDAGGAGGPFAGSVTFGHPGTVIENGQCAVSFVSASSTASTLTIGLNISFKPGFGGNLIQFAAARDTLMTSDWQALGVWNAPSASGSSSIAVANMTPARTVTAAGAEQSFTFTFSDSKGAADIGVLNVLINDFLDGRHACYLAYVAPAKTLLLVDDAGDAGGPFAGVSNSQCSIRGSSVTTVGNLLMLTVNIAFQTPPTGNRVVWVAGRDIAGGNNTGWQAMGTVSVQ